jgi:hypothetical protein
MNIFNSLRNHLMPSGSQAGNPGRSETSVKKLREDGQVFGSQERRGMLEPGRTHYRNMSSSVKRTPTDTFLQGSPLSIEHANQTLQEQQTDYLR